MSRKSPADTHSAPGLMLVCVSSIERVSPNDNHGDEPEPGRRPGPGVGLRLLLSPSGSFVATEARPPPLAVLRFWVVPDLVAVVTPTEVPFDDLLRRLWDDGAAVLPVDGRLPEAARSSLLERLAPTHVLDPDGSLATRGGGRPVEDGDALVVATSGTTGEPRGVVLTHEAVRASAEATSARLEVDAQSDRWLACLPLSHVGGLGVVTRAVVTDTPVTVHAGFDAAAVEAAAADHTLVSLVATALGRIDASRYRVALLGGDRPPDHPPPNVVSTYGMTETGGGVVYDGVPLDGVEVDVRDRRIQLRGPMIGRTYRDGEPITDGDGWLDTGDVGRWIDGRLIVDGREGDMIVTGGENVFPTAVEATLASHPSVSEVAIAGTPDPEWGQAVTAWVVPVSGKALSLEDLRAYGRDQLPAHALPRRLELVETLPRTALGKVRRAALGTSSPPTPR